MISEIANNPVQRTCAHVVRTIAGRAHQIDNSGAGTLGNLIDLMLEHQILCLRGAIDERDVLAWQVDRLEGNASA